jgi:hypothetical protein
MWLPLVDYRIGGAQVGGGMMGYDAIDTHRYSLQATYNTNTQLPDWQATYSTLILGPNITFSNSMESNYASFDRNTTLSFQRQSTSRLGLSYPFLKTYSSFTASLAYNIIRFKKYVKPNNTPTTCMASTPFVHATDLVWTYRNVETSDLAVVYESGNAFQFATRNYILPGGVTWKNLLLLSSYFRWKPHTIFNPQIKGLWSTQINPNFPQSGSALQGRVLETLLNPIPSDGFNLLSLRGYPNLLSAPALFAGSASFDLSFPFARIFEGWGTRPLFFKNLYGFLFAETSYVRSISAPLPSAGFGLRFTSTLFYIPLTLSTEYHRGFQQALGGKNDFFFQILASNILAF